MDLFRLPLPADRRLPAEADRLPAERDEAKLLPVTDGCEEGSELSELSRTGGAMGAPRFLLCGLVFVRPATIGYPTPAFTAFRIDPARHIILGDHAAAGSLR